MPPQVFAFDMVIFKFLSRKSKCRVVDNKPNSKKRRPFLSSTNMSHQSSNLVDAYLSGRHERAMVRLCALLWIAKFQEYRMNYKKLQLEQQQKIKSLEGDQKHEVDEFTFFTFDFYSTITWC